MGDEFLTPAARAALDEYMTELRSEILLRAVDLAREAEVSAKPSVTVMDILRAADLAASTQARQVRTYSHESRRTVSFLVGFLMMGLMMAGTLVILVARKPGEGSQIDSLFSNVAIALGLVPVATTLAALLLETKALRHRNGPTPNRSELIGLFFGEYNNLELSLRSRVADSLGEFNTRESPIRAYLRLPTTRKTDAEKLHTIIAARNALAHEGKISTQEIVDSLTLARSLNEGLRGARE